MSNIHEECGVFGVFSNKKSNLAAEVYYGLFALQHRGQESCGIVVNDDGVFASYKDTGIVNDVFTQDVIEELGEGNIALGHVRYGTSKAKGRSNAQPLVINHIKGHIAIANNGSLVNASELREALEMEGSIFHTFSDAEVLAYMITKERITSNSIEEAVNKAVYKLKGAFSFAIMSPTKLIAVRDPNGFRPLCYGQTDSGDYIVASESCALDAIGAKLIRDVKPGEILVFDKDGVRSITEHCDKVKTTSCIFEYVYFARPDSVIDGVSVHAARLQAGAFLAQEHPVNADVVIGVPDSGIDAAVGYAKESGIPYGMGFTKNRYIARTFIQPGQSSRENLVRIKLNPISETVKGKRVILIDDSIVRGTTCERIVKLLKEAGASEIHMRVTAPPFIDICYYGTDIESKDALIACKHNEEEIRKMIGVDSLGFLNLEHAKQITGKENSCRYCTACFDSIFPTEIPAERRARKYDKKISEGKKR